MVIHLWRRLRARKEVPLVAEDFRGGRNIPNTMNIDKSLFSMMCKVKKRGKIKIK